MTTPRKRKRDIERLRDTERHKREREIYIY